MTGDSFFSDGAAAADAALSRQFPALGANNVPLQPTPTPWSHATLLSSFFNATPVPSIGGIWAHYSHWLAQPAFLPTTFSLTDFGSTKDINSSHSLAGRLLFTVGCHGGLTNGYVCDRKLDQT